jgi:YHS domain-containing protein
MTGLRRGLAGAALAALALLAGCSTLNNTADRGHANLMLRGHDPVAYAAAGRAVAGRADIRVEHRGTTYYFASDESRRQFITDPEQYLPQFGGFCAQAMAYAIPMEGDPGSFKIIDGKLYLFGSARQKAYFEMDQERNLKLALHYWEAEVRDSNRHLQALKRLVFRVPHYKSNADLAEEYQKRFGRVPG